MAIKTKKKPRVLLANLPWQKGENWGVRAGSRWPHIKDKSEGKYLPFPFFLAYAASLLKKHDIEAEVIDAVAEGIPADKFLDSLSRREFDILVVETSVPSFDYDLGILEKIAALNIPVVLCGPQPQMYQEGFLSGHKFVEFVLYGEYEWTLLELMRALSRGERDFSAISGLIWKDSSGKAVKNARREPFPIDTLPWPERAGLPMEKYWDLPGGIPQPSVQMVASRGCSFGCNFCLWPQVLFGGRTYRARNIKDVVDEMEYLIKEKGYKSVYFDDDTFNIGKPRMLEFCAELIRRDLHQIPWAIMAKADIMDKEILDQMKEAGLYAVKYGVESAAQELVDRCGKNLQLAKAEEMIEYTKSLGVKVHLTFSFGLPGETKETAQRTVDYAVKLDPHSVQFSIITPFPGTALFEELDREGRILTKDFSLYDGHYNCVFQPDNLAASELEEIKESAYKTWEAADQIKRSLEGTDKRTFRAGKIVFPPEIKKITSITIKGHPEIIRYEDYKKFDVIGRYDNPDQRKYPPRHPTDGIPCIYLCGDNSEVHRWGVDLDETDFFKQINKLKELSAQQQVVHIIVGVRRTNFHRLHHIGDVIFAIKNQHKPDLPGFAIKPLRGIRDRFYKYLSEVNELVKNAGVVFRIVDAQLDTLLTVIERNAEQLCFQENNFLRALGVVCKDVFTGPAFILLDLAGRCNVDCVYCRRFSPFIQKSWKERHPEMTGFLDFEVVRNILVEAKEIGVESVLLVGGGEPTIHPKFFEIINSIKSLGMDFNFSTNGTTLDAYNKYLVDGRCVTLTASLSFASAESYRRIRPYSDTGLMQKIEKGVRNLADLKKECMVSLPQIIALYAVCKYNYKEIVQMALHAKKLGADKIWYQLVHLEDFSKNELFMSSEDMEKVKQLLKEAKEVCEQSGLIFDSFIDFEMVHYDEKRGDWSKEGLLQQGCFVGWHFVFIHLNLEVFMCCGRKTMGVLDEQGKGLKDLWNSDVYRRYRNDGLIMHKENPLTLLGSPLYEAYCDSCDNHDQNEKMIAYIKGYALEEFLER